jgi:DNA-binding response OmpR family regulator
MNSPRLLLTEPDPFFASAAIRQLRQVGFEVVHAAHGQEGWEMVSREPFDLIVTELVLPRMDGYQLLEAIRGQADLAALPVFILTRLGAREDVERCREQGIGDYFIKPHHRLDWIAQRLFQTWQQHALSHA